MSFSLAVEAENDDTNIVFQLCLPGTTITPFHEKQGVKPAAGIMYPDVVAKRSFDNIDSSIFIPNRMDKAIPILASFISKKRSTKIARRQIKKRLGLNKAG